MDVVDQQEVSSLENLEARILKAVETVNRLRQEKESALARAQAMAAEKEALEKELAASQGRIDGLSKEIEAFREERRQVRKRIEKLLGQIDLISAEQ